MFVNEYMPTPNSNTRIMKMKTTPKELILLYIETSFGMTIAKAIANIMKQV